ncbi:extracellular solute-binding protein [Breznakiella homolactica]|uniref:Extracellular solute-binding protein n=1 Tax=Breznakiella homolactica TaxID=2798577 RepID=A0A7T7XL43_9SPIR|nr:extracellular solute-binding protein [Breznakiella homolactica]QQO08306.1 extracellular solute-binding protein [Breznakiella homolactica]
MVRRKKCMVLGIAALVVFLLSGCGKSSSGGTAGGRASTDPAFYEVTEPITIEWWHALEDQYSATVESIVAGFNNSQSLITVVPRFIGNYTVLNETLVAAHAAGTGLPAITAANTPYVAEYGAGGLTENLSPYIQATNFDIEDFGEGMIAATNFDGKQVAMPFLISTQVVYYNADMARQLNVQVPERLSDMESFLKAASKIGPDRKTQQWAFIVPGWDQWYFETFYLNNGVKIINDDQISTDLNSPAAVAIAEQFKKWCDAGYMYWASGTSASSIMRQNFWEGKAFSVAHTSSLYNTYVDNCPFEVGMAWLPAGDTKISEIGGSVILIPAKNDQKTKNAAWQFMQYMINKDTNMKWARETGYMPTRKSVLYTEEGQKFLQEKPAFKVIFDNLDEINPRIQHGAWGQLAKIWIAYMQETILENKNVPSQMDKMAQEINEVLEDY